MHKTIHDLQKSFRFIGYFYIPLFFIVCFVLLLADRGWALALPTMIVFSGSLFLVIFTQVSNYIIEKQDILERTREFLYINFTDCFYRCCAGLSEVVLYTVAFSFRLEAVIAGYLLLKTVSIWQDNVKNKKEGLHTAILRSAIVFSILIALIASYYVRKFISVSE